MSWFFLALIPPALWAATNHIDKYLISKHLRGGSVGALVIVSALAATIVLPFILIFHPESLSATPLNALILAINGGVAIAGLLFYFWSLAKDDASVVVPLFELIPVFSYLFGFLILGETLSGNQLVAFVVILLGSILISLDLDKKFRLKKEILLLMTLSCLVNALYGVVFKKFAINEGFWPAIFWSQTGLVLAGGVMLAFVKSFRRDFLAIIRKNNLAVIGLNLTNEIVNTAAVLLSGYTLLLAPVAIISVIGSFQSVFVFIFGIILTLFFPRINQESMARHHLLQRIAAILIITYGSWLLNRG